MTEWKLAQRRALMRRLWNDGDSSHSDIAAAVGCDVEVVANWLAKQPGYPGIISPRMVACAVCGVAFPTWRQAASRYCSATCQMQARRKSWRESRQRNRGFKPAQWQSRILRGLSQSDRRVVEAAKEEARERGTTRDAVLAEWKFEPERKTA